MARHNKVGPSRAELRRSEISVANKANAARNAAVLAEQGLEWVGPGQLGYSGGGEEYYDDSGANYDGGGYEDGGGGYGGPVSYEPDPALVAALERLIAAGGAAGVQINDAEAAWRQRLAQLRAIQEADNAAVASQIQGDAARQAATYESSLNPILGDLQAQGFSASPIQQQAALDRSRFSDYGQRQADLSRRFAEIQSRSFADRDAAATGQMAGARGVLANNLAKMRSELEIAIAESMMGGSGGGGGGGGGGYGRSGYGRSGSGGNDDAPLGILSALGAANTPLADPRATINYGGKNRGMVNKFTRRINDNLTNVGTVERKFVRAAENKGLNRGGFVKGVRRQVFQPLRKAAPKYQQSLSKRAAKRAYVEAWANG